MVGLGETHEEMVEAFGDLREQGVQVLTVGQYLRPTERHLPVVRYWEPEEFTALEAAALALGLRARRRRPAGPLLLPRGRARVKQTRPGVGPLARRRLSVPAPRQHPDRALPGRHGRADRR